MADLVSRLQDLLGAGRVVAGRDPAVGGPAATLQEQAPVAYPLDEEQLSHVLRLAEAERLTVRVAGGGTKSAWGALPAKTDIVLSTRDLAGVTDLDPENLSMSVRAGTRVAAARASARDAGRLLPLDSRRPELATIGGVVAVNDQGARRMSFGGVRDLLLGMRVVLADGRRVTFGGRTMKNVTGYDLTKLFVGSMGSLGVITEVTLRLVPPPAAQAVLILPLDSPTQSGRLAARVLDSVLEPLCLEVVTGTFAREVFSSQQLAGWPDGTAQPAPLYLLAGFAGHPAAVKRSLAELVAHHLSLQNGGGSLAELWDGEAEPVFRSLAESSAVLTGSGYPVAARLTLPLSEVWAAADAADAAAATGGFDLAYRISAGSGAIDLSVGATGGEEAAFEASLVPQASFLVALRATARGAGGHLVVTDGLEVLPAGFDGWGASSGPVALTRALKQQFDPSSVLCPGRLAGGI